MICVNIENMGIVYNAISTTKKEKETIVMKKRDFILLYKARVAGKDILKNDTLEATAHKVTNVKEYVDGKATDNIIGSYIHILPPDDEEQGLKIKVLGESKLTNEMIHENGGALRVRFVGLEGKYYRKDNDWVLACSAKEVIV